MKKISKLQVSRFILQIIFLVLYPGLFTLAFNESKEIYTMILKGNFNFIEAFPKLIEVLALIPLTIIAGRFFCGWMCAFGTMNDIIYFISKKVFKIKFKVSEEVGSALKYVKYVLLVVLVVAVWTFGSTIFEGSSPWDAFAQLPNFSEAITSYAIGSAILALIIVGAMFIERFFCRYLCPMGAIFAIASKLRVFNINKPTEKCGKCRACTNNCAMGIPLYETEKVKSSECINCLKCVTVCPRKNAQAAILDENINPAIGSAVAVAAFTGIYSVSNVLANNSNVASATEISTSTTQSGTLSSSTGATYKDGAYTGTGNGYRPNLQVSVTIKNNKITDIKIGSNNETPSYASRPFSTIPQAIIKAQSTDVDTISGATRTCRGIIMAVEDALNDAKTSTSSAGINSSSSSNSNNSSTSSSSSSSQSSNSAINNSTTASNSGSTTKSSGSSTTANSGSTSSSNSTSSSSNSGSTPSAGTANNSGTTTNSSSSSNTTTSPGTTSNSNSTATSKVTYKDGTYTGVGQGYRPGLNVTVTVKDNKITNIQIGSNNETPRYAQRPFSTIPQQIIATQSTKVDTISGATRTCKGIIMAVEDALNDAM